MAHRWHGRYSEKSNFYFFFKEMNILSEVDKPGSDVDQYIN